MRTTIQFFLALELLVLFAKKSLLTRIAFLDIAKAFDDVCYYGFMVKICLSGIDGQLCTW